jgi:hypothetical protein
MHPTARFVTIVRPIEGVFPSFWSLQCAISRDFARINTTGPAYAAMRIAFLRELHAALRAMFGDGAAPARRVLTFQNFIGDAAGEVAALYDGWGLSYDREALRRRVDAYLAAEEHMHAFGNASWEEMGIRREARARARVEHLRLWGCCARLLLRGAALRALRACAASVACTHASARAHATLRVCCVALTLRPRVRLLCPSPIPPHDRSWRSWCSALCSLTTASTSAPRAAPRRRRPRRARGAHAWRPPRPRLRTRRTSDVNGWLCRAFSHTHTFSMRRCG